MFQMPTGTGKTRLFTSIIQDINEYSIQRREAVKILIIAHRTELIAFPLHPNSIWMSVVQPLEISLLNSKRMASNHHQL